MIISRFLIEDNQPFNSKFLRVGNEVYITDPGDTATLHINLAKKDKIYDRIIELKAQNPNNIDGGLIFISGKVIRIGSASTSLSIPLVDKARKNTINILKKEFPNYSIKELADE